MKTYNGYERLPRNYTCMTDQYQLSMAYGYYANGKVNDEAVFEVFNRKIPNNGGYVVMAGLDKIIPYIQNLTFSEQELNRLKKKGVNKDFIDYLRNFKFTGDIYAIPDGTPIFTNEPAITIKAPIIEGQIIETAILSMINGATEHATGARRIIEATPKGKGVMEFGARRADGCEAAIDSSIYGLMAGCIGTSNVMAADMVDQQALGTQAHSWIEAYPTEYEAFLAYAKAYPDSCTLLVDTYDTLKSGIPNAIRVAQEYLIPNGYNLKGIRIDSGDLVVLSKEARKMLDEAGLTEAKICLSNGLTAEEIERITKAGACYDTLGTGDNISKPEGRMGFVYKLTELNNDPRIKLSEDAIKIINPGFKKLYRAYDKETGYAVADVMMRRGQMITEDHLAIVDPQDDSNRIHIQNINLVELQQQIFKQGQLVYEDPEMPVKKAYCEQQMQTLTQEIRKTTNPDKYFVSGTEEYVEFKKDFIRKTKQLVKTRVA